MKLAEFHKIAGPFKYILPTYYYEVLTSCIHEYKNYLFWKNKISEIATTSDYFEYNNMNVSDDHTEFYFAVNMPPENKSLPLRDREEIESKVLVSNINKIENGLADYGLYDLIRFNYEHVDRPDDGLYGWVVSCTFNRVSLTDENIRFCYIYSAVILALIFALVAAIVWLTLF